MCDKEGFFYLFKSVPLYSDYVVGRCIMNMGRAAIETDRGQILRMSNVFSEKKFNNCVQII